MANELVLPSGMLPSAKMQQALGAHSDLGEGITAGFAIVSYRGKVFRLKYKGDEKPLLRDDGSAIGAINVVIVQASPAISKIYYKNGFREGDNSPPTCFSTNGVTPDAASAEKQCTACAGCPMNAWGSRITEDGRKGKACADSKRLAIVPDADLKNELFGGPMLIRVPAASLSGLSTYANLLQSQGFPYFGVVTQISFDIQEAYPHLLFKPIRALTDAEFDIVLEHQKGDVVKRILSDPVEQVRADVIQPGQTGQGVPSTMAPVPNTAPPVVATAVFPAPPVTPAPAPVSAPSAPANPFAQPPEQPQAPVAAAPTATVAPPQPTPAPAPQTGTAAPVATPFTQPAQVEETIDQRIARLSVAPPGETTQSALARMTELQNAMREKLAQQNAQPAATEAAPAKRTRKPRTAPPSPTPTPEVQAQPVTPAATPPVAAGGVVMPDMASISARLEGLV